MGKRLRYIILTFTIVLAVAVFAMLWQVRPGFDSKVLDEARARQEKTLLEVSAPLKTDVVQLTAEEEMAQKVSAILKADEDFINTISDKLETLVPKYVEEYTMKYTSDLNATIRNEVETALADLTDSSKSTFFADLEEGVLQKVDEKIAVKENEFNVVLDEREKALIENITTSIYNIYEEKKAELTEALMADVRAMGEEMILNASDATEIAVLNKIASQEDYYVDLVASAFADGMLKASMGEGEVPYTDIMDNSTDGVLTSLSSSALSEDEKAKSAIENIVLAVLEKIDVQQYVDRLEALEEGMIMPIAPSTFSVEEEVEPVVEEVVEEPVVPAEPAVEEPVVEEVKVPSPAKVAVAPTFTSPSEETVPTSAEEYENEREKLRKAEIDRILNGLMKKNK